MRLFKKHYLAIAIALVAGTATAIPQIIAAGRVENFQGIYKSINSDEQYYMARAKDIVDGHSFLSNPYLYEYKNGQPMQFWLPDYLMAKPLALLNVDIYKGFFFYDFFLPFILVLLSYYILFKLTDSVPLSIIGVVFLHLSLFLWEFGRAPSPQLIFIFWLLLLLLWLKFLNKPNTANAVAIGSIFGLLFYIYPYYWTFYSLAFFIFIAVNYFLKNNIAYKKYFLAFAVAAIISIPYFTSLFKSFQLPYYSDSVARVGMINSHFPAGRRVVMWNLFALLFFYILYRKKAVILDEKSLLLLSGCAAVILAVNQHLITGKYLQFSNHYWQLGAFWSVYTVLYLTSLLLKKIDSRIIRSVLLSTVGVLAITSAYVPLVKACDIRYNEAEIKRQDYAPLFVWLNENTKIDEVVYVNSDLSNFIPNYTSNNVFYIGMAGLHFMPNEEFQERYVLNNFWDNWDNYDYEYVKNNYYAIKGAYYRSKQWHNSTKNNLRKILFLQPAEYKLISAEDIEDVNEFIKLMTEIKSKNFKEQLSKYKVDYIIWDKEANPEWKVEDLSFVKHVQNIGKFTVYKIIK